VPAEHQLVLDGVLDLLDFQFLSTDRATKDLFNYLVRAALDIGLGGFGKRIILPNFVVGFKGALNGQEDAGFIEFFQPTVSLANKELSVMQGVNSLHVQLIVSRIGHKNQSVPALHVASFPKNAYT
jgi:hypothetical protein